MDGRRWYSWLGMSSTSPTKGAGRCLLTVCLLDDSGQHQGGADDGHGEQPAPDGALGVANLLARIARRGDDEIGVADALVAVMFHSSASLTPSRRSATTSTTRAPPSRMSRRVSITVPPRWLWRWRDEPCPGTALGLLLCSREDR